MEAGRRVEIPAAVQKIGWIGLGGFLGANARYWLGVWIQQRWGSQFPWATFCINISGAFALGFLASFLSGRFTTPPDGPLRLAVAVGFLGAYTTFSTYELEIWNLATQRGGWWPWAYGLGSVAAGFAAVAVGFWLGRRV